MSDKGIKVSDIPTMDDAKVGSLLASLVEVGRAEGFSVGTRQSGLTERAEVTLSGLPDVFRQPAGYPDRDQSVQQFTIEDAPGVGATNYMKVSAPTLLAALQTAVQVYLAKVTTEAPAPRLEVVR